MLPLIVALGVIVLAGVGFAVYGVTHSSATPTATPGPTPTAVSLAPAVDGIQCLASEALVYHIHQHLTLYDHGKQIPVPSSIGMPGGESNARCFYWIHVHASTPNIIHVESPIQKTFTLGNFVDIWKATKTWTTPREDAYLKKLTSSPGQVTAFYNGKLWHGSYRSIPLTSHADIAIEIGKPIVRPKPFTNWGGL